VADEHENVKISLSKISNKQLFIYRAYNVQFVLPIKTYGVFKRLHIFGQILKTTRKFSQHTNTCYDVTENVLVII